VTQSEAFARALHLPLHRLLPQPPSPRDQNQKVREAERKPPIDSLRIIAPDQDDIVQRGWEGYEQDRSCGPQRGHSIGVSASSHRGLYADGRAIQVRVSG
jgi:hypothetical protein